MCDKKYIQNGLVKKDLTSIKICPLKNSAVVIPALGVVVLEEGLWEDKPCSWSYYKSNPFTRDC